MKTPCFLFFDKELLRYHRTVTHDYIAEHLTSETGYFAKKPQKKPFGPFEFLLLAFRVSDDIFNAKPFAEYRATLDEKSQYIEVGPTKQTHTSHRCGSLMMTKRIHTLQSRGGIDELLNSHHCHCPYIQDALSAAGCSFSSSTSCCHQR